MNKLTYNQKYWLSNVSAYLVAIGVPVGTTFAMFPNAIYEKTSVGLALVVSIVVSLTLFKRQIANAVSNSATVATWATIVGVCVVCKYFVDQLLVVSLAGLASNAVSIPLFKIAENNKALVLKIKEEKQKIKVKEVIDNEQQII